MTEKTGPETADGKYASRGTDYAKRFLDRQIREAAIALDAGQAFELNGRLPLVVNQYRCRRIMQAVVNSENEFGRLMQSVAAIVKPLGDGRASVYPPMRGQKCQTTKAHMAVITIKSTAASGPVMSSIGSAPMLSSPLGLRTLIE